MVMYSIKLYGSNTLATITNGLVEKSTVVAYTDTAAAISAGTQPIVLECYFIRPDDEPVGERLTGIGDLLLDPYNIRDTFEIQTVNIDLFADFETLRTNLKLLQKFKNKYLEVTTYEFDIDDHVSGGKLFPVVFEKSIETQVGIKIYTFECKGIKPN